MTHGCADYWVLRKGVRHHGLGAADTLPLSLFDSGWQAHVDSHLADSVVRAEISNNT